MYLGFDIGTSGVKAVLVDEAGEVRHQASAEYPVSHPRPLWSEQDPELWWNACVAAVAALKAAGAALAAVKAIGLSGQMHGATLLDATGAVLRPCILWNDGRSHAECAELEAAVAEFRDKCGNMAMPGFTAPKLLWVRKHEPQVFQRIHKVLLPKDYLHYRLTGGFASDMSDAAGTLWLDPARRDWSEELLAATGLDRSHMPELFEGCAAVDELSAAAARTLGVPPVPVVAGAGDNAGGAVGVGVIEPGQGFLSLGTSGVLFVVSERHHARPEKTVHAFCHCLPKRWHQMAVSLSAASSLAWLARTVGVEVAELLRRLEARGKSETPVLFLPYLSGERTPHNDPRAVGQFHGLTHATDLTDLTLAVLEGVAYSFCDGLDALRAAGAELREIALLGGGARSPLWRQLLADALELPLDYRTGGEVGPALGAARLAMIGVAGGDVEAAIARVCAQPPPEVRYQPQAARTAYHRAKLARYRQLYALTRELHRDDA
ncbi:MAG TPA: xylulokinase [Candidatus Competibacteraceae bacterium]|nr:xylulokinase [Candidatus Competibacteraceae bacterium]